MVIIKTLKNRQNINRRLVKVLFDQILSCFVNFAQPNKNKPFATVQYLLENKIIAVMLTWWNTSLFVLAFLL